MKRNLNRHIKQSGFTLTELAVVTVIGAVLIGASLKPVQGMIADSRANSEIQELSVVIPKIQNKYFNKSDYTGVTTAGLANNGIFRKERVSGTSLVNRWGGAITVAVATTTTTNDSVTLTYTKVPEQECKGIIPQLDNIVRIVTVGGTSVKADGAGTDIDALGTQCVAGGSNNTVVYTVGKQ